MTYDEWKLETPEDEEARINRGRSGWRDMRDAERCWNCRMDWKADETDELLCFHCGADAQDAPAERAIPTTPATEAHGSGGDGSPL